MALDKVVDSQALDDALDYTADRIRVKLGNNDPIAFDLTGGKGFGDAIDAIETGGGEDNIVKLNSNNLPTYSSDSITILRASLFQNCTSLTSLSLPNAQQIGGSAIRNTGLAVFVGLKVNEIADSGIGYNASLTAIDILGKASASLRNGALRNNAKLTTVILRFNGVVANGGSNVFTSTPFASTGTGGTLYVPQALIASYQSATNWSTILGYANNQILPIEGSIYETQYADGTPIT